MTAASITSPELEAIIARTSLKYDLLPYTSNPFPQTHPGRLSALARLFGLETAPLASARVLELGCAAGGNIIPHAARTPGARFVGVDLSRTQVAAGRGRISDLGLDNIQIECRSFTELGTADGTFDYIICHGVYSWVPAPVRDAILRICRERLSDKGVAIISYNVLPGWRLLQTLRDCFVLQTAHLPDARQRVVEARKLLKVLGEGAPETGAYKQLIATWANRLASLPDDYIGHEFLEEINEPCTFREFIVAAGRHGLAYLGESDLPSMVVENQPAETAKRIRELAGNQNDATEQVLDMMTGRTFRQSLLVAADRAGRIDRNLAPQRIQAMHFLAVGELTVTHEANGGGAVADAFGRKLTTTSAHVMQALGTLIRRHPASSSLDEMIAELPAAGRTLESRTLVAEALLRMTLAGLVAINAEPIRAVASVTPKPLACPLARKDAARGDATTANVRHERIGLDSLGQVLLPALDGTRDGAALVALTMEHVSSGRLNFFRDGVPIRDQAALATVVPEQINGLLKAFARAGLLVG